jgi:hypothetical protein
LELTVRERDDLDGTGKVILEILQNSTELQAGDVVRLSAGRRACGAIVESVQSGGGAIGADPQLRVHLGTRPGGRVDLEPLACVEANSVRLLAPAAWTDSEGSQLLRVMLLGRPLCAGQRLRLYTLKGDPIDLEVVHVDPDGIVRIGL